MKPTPYSKTFDEQIKLFLGGKNVQKATDHTANLNFILYGSIKTYKIIIRIVRYL
jgi:hypothetical protein